MSGRSRRPPAAENAADRCATSYQAGGRRDPFLNLLGTRHRAARAPAKRGDGLAGLIVNEIAIRGVMQSGPALIAMIQGPDGKTTLFIRATSSWTAP